MKLAQDYLNSIAELVTMPEVYRRIRKLIAAPNSKIEDYVEVVDADPALAARIIRIANSTFFGYSRETDSLEGAISLIGIMQLHDLLLSSLAIRAFSGIPNNIVNLHDFWRSSIFCGISARMLARKCRVPASERLFTSGLLHEIGHIVMYTQDPEKAQEILLTSEQQSKPIYLMEREKLGFDYAQLGCEVMRLWHLPESYQEITEFHPEPEKSTQFKIETSIVHLAHSMALCEETGSEFNENPLSIAPAAWKTTKLHDQVIEEVRTEARLHVDEVIDSLWPFPRKTQHNCTI